MTKKKFEKPPKTIDEFEAILEQDGVASPFTDEAESLNSTKRRIKRIKERWENKLMTHDGVVGLGIGKNPIGDPCILIYVVSADRGEALPATLDGAEVAIVVSGDIDTQ